MKSMTGYGVSHWKSNNCYIEVVVQSYNSKYFESRLQSPPCYHSLEGELKKELQKSFCRGFISLNIVRNPLWPEKKTTVKWNKAQALKWKNLYKEISSSLKLTNNLDVLQLAQQPGVLEILSQPSIVSVTEKNKLKTLVKQSISLCDTERLREGTALKKDFQNYLKKINSCFKKVKLLSNTQSKKVYKNVKNKIDDFNTANDKKTVEDITGLLIKKMDTSEEITRMAEHIEVFLSLINSQESSIGKQIAFYLQEMIREMNTIGSKSQSFPLTREVIQIKSFIEKMREQAQNVE